nr:MAG TPA: hypothetical protein [Caudoviricetes sp.]
MPAVKINTLMLRAVPAPAPGSGFEIDMLKLEKKDARREN